MILRLLIGIDVSRAVEVPGAVIVALIEFDSVSAGASRHDVDRKLVINLCFMIFHFSLPHVMKLLL